MKDSRITLTNGHPDPEWLGARHDGELSPVEARQIDEHVAGCAACGAVLADLAEISRLAPGLEPEPPDSAYWPGLTERILDRVAGESGQQRPGVAARAPLRPAGLRAAWRWAMPLAAVCGVALLSWRLLSSRPSLMGEIGDPGPDYRSKPVSSAPATPAPATPAPADRERAAEAPRAQDDALVGATAGSARRDAPREADRPQAKLPSAAASDVRQEQSRGGPGDVMSEQPSAVAPALGPGDEPPPAKSGLPPHFLAGLQKEGRPATDSLLAVVTLRADSLWQQLGWPDHPDRDTALRSTERKAAGALRLENAAPPDTVLARRSLALEEERLALLKVLHPRADRTEIEARVERLRRYLKNPQR